MKDQTRGDRAGNVINGKTIRIYLVDGVPSGILTAEIINWSGKVVVSPRSQLAQLASRQEFFLGQVQMVLPVLGFTFTQQLPELQPQPGRVPASTASPVFVMSPVGTHATAQEIDGEFIVFKGSTARKQGVEAWVSYRSLRDQLLAEGKLVDAEQEGLLVFTEDVAFSSPSAAAAVVYGGNQNGRTAWKVKDTGQTYQQWQEQKLAAGSATGGTAPSQDGAA